MDGNPGGESKNSFFYRNMNITGVKSVAFASVALLLQISCR
jgi:hypothetical protein